MKKPNGRVAPPASARAASLRYVSDTEPGIRRLRSGKGFRYRSATGRAVKDRSTLARLRSLAIPPAWNEVWICRIPHGHLQATGRDARGRKQYRYHPRWARVRDETKYERMAAFGATLPRIRAAVKADLARDGLPREKLLAALVRLLETTAIRVGNEEYVKANGSFGLTTLKNRHVKVRGDTVRFRFSGKSGKSHDITLSDARLARLVRRCLDLPGQELFQYRGEDGSPQRIDSSDVNDYLRQISGEDFTAKDFRTWAGTLLAARELAGRTGIAERSEAKGAIADAVGRVAEQLGNTAAVCRKCYIHPAILAAFDDPEAYTRWSRAASRRRGRRGLSRDEAALLRYLG